MSTPNDENFEAYPVDISGIGVVGPNTLGGFVFEGHRIDPGGAGDISTAVIDSTAVGLHIGGGKALALNYGYLFTTDWWQFRSVSLLDNFKLASLAVESISGGFDDVVTVSGYNDSGLVVSQTVDLTAGGGYGSISYAKIIGAVGGTLTFGAGWGNVDTVRFSSTAGDPYGTELWIDNIDVSAAVAIDSAAYDAASGVLTVAAGGVSAGELITAARLTLTGQGGNSHALTSGPVTAGAGSFSIALNAADKLFVNGLLNKNLLAADDGATFNLSAAAGWNTSSGAELDGTSPVSVSNVTTPSISSATYDAASGVLVATGSALSHAAGAANDIVAAKLTFIGQGGASYALTDTANVEISSATSFTLLLSAADRAAVDLLLNKNGAQSSGGTAYNLALGEDWAAGAAPGAVVADTSGNAITVSNVAADTTPPTATLSLSDSALKIGDSALLTIAFSEAVTGFTNADLALANGTLGAVASSDGGVTWTATFTPGAGVTDATNVITLDQGGVFDAAGNAGAGSASSANFTIDTQAPTAAIALSDSALAVGDTATVTITFSEAVTGLTLADLSAGAGTLSALASLDGGVTWSATLTPLAATASAANLITLAANSIADLAGNANLGAASSANYSVQTVRPTASVTLSDSLLAIGDTSLVTIVFSSAVSGLTNAGLTVPNGVLTPLASSDGGVTWSATFTPNAGVSAAANTITVDTAGVTNGAGNAGSGAASSGNFAIDTVRPTATIALSDSSLAMGETATVTIAFSEAVSGFTNAALVAEHGTLGALASNDGGVTWRATFTPDAATRATGAVRLATSGVQDLAGNAGDTQAVSNTYSIDTRAPGEHHDADFDGAPGSSVTVMDPATGLSMVILTVPVILAFDPAPNLGKPGVADIELGIAPAGLVLRLPLGAGVVADGPATLLAFPQATFDLIARIDGSTDTASVEQQEMRAQAHGFLEGLAAGATVETRTLILSSGTAFPAGQPIEVVGAGGIVGLVIDTGALRPDIVLRLDNVDFAAIIGAATVEGGAGRNQLVGNHLAQNFSLGEGDDFGAGGGGNDLLAGGLGNDLLFGGPGDDVLQGGRSDRGDWTFAVDPAGALVARHALAAFEPGAFETVAAAELNPAATSLGFVGVDAGRLVEMALMYDAAFGRAPDLGGLTFYARSSAAAGAVMQSFLGSSEWLAAGNEGLGDAAFLTKMYQQVLHRGPDADGFAFWLDALTGKNGPPVARAGFLTQFALSPEHRGLMAGGSGGIVVGAGTQVREGDWFAHSGDDRLSGGPGNDVIVGGDGVDTLVYSGKLDDYRFLLGRDGQLRVEDKASGDLDTISGIEKGEFSDGTIGLSFTQADPKSLQGVALTYQVVLDRAADADGLAFWLGAHDNPTHMAQMFVESAEFVHHYGTLDDAHFVATLLANSGVGSSGDVAAGWENWLGTHSRAELVVALIGDPAVTNAQFGANGLWVV